MWLCGNVRICVRLFCLQKMAVVWYNCKQVRDAVGGFEMAKVICESCGSSFPFEVIKEKKFCPVCNHPLFDEGEVDDNEDTAQDVVEEHDEGLMYFNEIMVFDRKPEYNNVCVYCSECGEDNTLELDKFDILKDGEYVILKEELVLKCKGCGKEHKPRKILYKKKESYAPPRAHCPACNSMVLKKIKTSSKVLAAAAVGVFALPYNSKTFECQNCGYRF